jgi:hypothetical protein
VVVRKRFLLFKEEEKRSQCCQCEMGYELQTKQRAELCLLSNCKCSHSSEFRFQTLADAVGERRFFLKCHRLSMV